MTNPPKVSVPLHRIKIIDQEDNFLYINLRVSTDAAADFVDTVRDHSDGRAYIESIEDDL